MQPLDQQVCEPGAFQDHPAHHRLGNDAVDHARVQAQDPVCPRGPDAAVPEARIDRRRGPDAWEGPALGGNARGDGVERIEQDTGHHAAGHGAHHLWIELLQQCRVPGRNGRQVAEPAARTVDRHGGGGWGVGGDGGHGGHDGSRDLASSDGGCGGL